MREIGNDYQSCARTFQNICKFNDCFTELTLTAYTSVGVANRSRERGFSVGAKRTVAQNKENDDQSCVKIIQIIRKYANLTTVSQN